MSSFLFGLATSLALPATLLTACHPCSLARPDLALNGGHTCLRLTAPALVFDARLTFFCSPTRRAAMENPARPVHSSGVRAFTLVYTLVCPLVPCCARCLRIRMKKAKASHALVIRTSPYRESHLPMRRAPLGQPWYQLTASHSA